MHTPTLCIIIALLSCSLGCSGTPAPEVSLADAEKVSEESSAPAETIVDTAKKAETSTPAEDFEAGIIAYQANNLPLAFESFLSASRKGHADSQYNLGLMYEQGIGVGRDETQAVVWYSQSAAQGNSAAQFNLGVLHENGRGTPVDFAQANKWYRNASSQGDPLAIGNLGMLYIRGDGVPVDKIAGVALLMVSATMDPSQGNLARRNITGTRGLTSEMIASAQQLSEKMSSGSSVLEPLDQYLMESPAGQSEK